MTFDQFELDLLNDAWDQMNKKGVQDRLSKFKELRKTPINNEAWFEWELYHHLLTIDRGWKKEKKNRKGKNRQRGDGVDLQFSNNRFVELRAVTTEKTSFSWVLNGLLQHEEADAVLFLALYYMNLRKWLEKYKTNGNKLRYKGQNYEITIKHINEDWIVGMIKKMEHNSYDN